MPEYISIFAKKDKKTTSSGGYVSPLAGRDYKEPKIETAPVVKPVSNASTGPIDAVSKTMPKAPYPVQPNTVPKIPVVDNRPFPMRVPGTTPTKEEQIKYAPKPISNLKVPGIDLSLTTGTGLTQEKRIQQNQVNAKLAADTKAKQLAEANKFYDTEYETATGKVKGKDIPVQSKIFEPVDTSKNKPGVITFQSPLAKGSKTYGEIVDKYNGMSAADQHAFLSSLSKVASSNPLNSPELQNNVNDASIALSLLDEKGKNKTSTIGSFLKDLVSGTVDSALKGSSAISALAEAGMNTVAGKEAGTTYSEQKAEQDFKDGKISASELASARNQGQLTRQELIGTKPKSGFEGVIDKALRLGGAVANTAGLVMPLESFWSASTKTIAGMTAKEIAITYFKEGLNNAITNALSAFQSTGTDTKWEDVLTQGAMGAGFGLGGRALGDVVQYLTRAKMTPKMFSELPPEIQLDYIKKATEGLPIADVKEVADAVKTGTKNIEEAPTPQAKVISNLEESTGTKIPERQAANLAENAPEAPQAPVVGKTPLHDEALKYNNPDEFIKSQGQPLYHGTNANFDTLDSKMAGTSNDYGVWGEGTYVTPHKDTAVNYGKNIHEVYGTPKNPLDVNSFKSVDEAADYLDMSPDALRMDEDGSIRPVGNQASQFSSHVKEKGYDGIIKNRGDKSTEIVLFDTNNIKTKQQLTDIYNEAHSLAPQVSKTPEISTPKVETPVIEAPKVEVKKPKVTTTSTVGTSKLATRVKKAAMRKKMIYGFDKTFNDLPEYDRVTRKEQMTKATDFILNDRENAIKVAMGKQAAPDGILNNSVWMAVKEYAENTGDVELMRQLAQSEIVTRATGMGQEISMLAEKNPHSAVENIRQVRETRAKAMEKKYRTTIDKEVKKAKVSVDKVTPKASKETWASFISGLEC